MAGIEIKNLGKSFRSCSGETIHAVRALSFTIAPGELVVLLGPSGCGKTTTLRLIAGLDAPSTGDIFFSGKSIKEVPPQDRDVAMVFQRDALYPHLTVARNLAFGLTIRGTPKAQAETRARETAEMLGLTALFDQHSGSLSGGERQRVALGRALARSPKIILLDEPLSQLDAPLRVQLRKEISQLNHQLGVTMLYVTHDQSEAFSIGHRIAIMREGTLQQIAEPDVLRQSPANRFVADFLGQGS